MKKKWKIVLKVIYYLFTFAIGILLAIIVPTANKDIVRTDFLNQYIEDGEYYKAIDLLGGLYNKEEYGRYKSFENSNTELIIFETALTYEYLEKTNPNDPESEEVRKSSFNASYACILHGVDKDKFAGEFDKEKENLSKIVINKTEELVIVNTDYDRDGNDDSISTLVDHDYLFFKLDKDKLEKITSIEIYQADGTLYYGLDINLQYNSDFFIETKEFIEKYNLYLNDDGYFNENEDKELKEIYDKIKTNNENYLVSGQYSENLINKKANRDSVIFVLIYFIWIYILGDCLVGQRYIFRFIKFIYNKVRTKENKKNKKEPEVFGNSFYCSLTLEAITNEKIQNDIVIAYRHIEDEENNFECIITRGKDYKEKIRVRGGTYKLVKSECLGYEISNLPEELVVKGYVMAVKFNIEKGK